MTQLVHFITTSGHTELESPMTFSQHAESGTESLVEFMGDMGFSLLWILRTWVSGIRRRIVWYIGTVSEESAATTFRVEEWRLRQRILPKQYISTRLRGVISHKIILPVKMSPMLKIGVPKTWNYYLKKVHKLTWKERRKRGWLNGNALDLKSGETQFDPGHEDLTFWDMARLSSLSLSKCKVVPWIGQSYQTRYLPSHLSFSSRSTVFTIAKLKSLFFQEPYFRNDKNVKFIKLSLLHAVEAHRVVRRRGSNIF
jgi:hypothetical protein